MARDLSHVPGQMPAGKSIAPADMTGEAKYTLSLSVPGAEAGAPAVRHLHSLAGALAAAWAHDNAGGKTLGIAYEGTPVMGEEELGRCFERMRAMEGDRPSGDWIICAARVLRERGLG